MGRQVNFYMTAEDERQFVTFIRSMGNVAILGSVQLSKAVLELQELPPVGEPFWFALCLWNKDCSPAPKMEYVTEQNYYCVEETESEVVEFSRSGVCDGRLVRGRIWAEMTYWQLDDPPVVVKKSAAFGKFYDRLANWLRRQSVRDGAGNYVFPGARDFATQRP